MRDLSELGFNFVAGLSHDERARLREESAEWDEFLQGMWNALMSVSPSAMATTDTRTIPTTLED